MVNFKLILITTLLSVYCIYSQTPSSWTAEELAKYSYTQEHNSTIDPNGYLNLDENYKNVTYLIDDIKTLKNFDVSLFIINKIDGHKYSQFFTSEKNIELFTNDLSYLILNGDKEKEKFSMFVVFAIEDKQMRIRTGSEVKSLLSDDRLKGYLDDLKSELRDKKYGKASLKLLQKIFDRLSAKHPLLDDFLEILLVVGIVIGIVGIFVLLEYCSKRKYRLDSSEQSKLNKIKELSTKNKTKKEIIETTCVICLEEFEKLAHNSIYNQHNENVHDGQLNPRTECILQPKINDHGLTSLDCRHTFHSNCISLWMNTQTTCPTCRHQVDSDNDRKIAQDLIIVHTVFHPNFSNYLFDYDSGLTWKSRYVPSSSNNTGSSSYSTSWNEGSGGASSSW